MSAPVLAAPEQAPDVASSPAPVRWHSFGIADLVFLLVALMVLRGARHTLLDDPGVGWHLRNVDAMLAHGGWLTEDPFSEHGDGPPRRWWTNQWLGEAPFWLGWKLAGLEGIAVVAALVVALAMRCLYRMLLADGLSWPVALLWTALTAVGTSCSWSARPNLFTIFFVLLTARACERFHTGHLSGRRLLWLLPLFAVWANVHGGFVAGLMIVGATLAAEIAVAVFAFSHEVKKVARVKALTLAGLLPGAVLATFVNPYGPALYAWVLQLLGDPYFMTLHQEWRSPDFQAPGALRFGLLMLLFPLLLGLSRRRPNLVELGLSVLWLYFALTGFRYVALWVVVTAPLLARSSVAVPWLRELADRLELSKDGESVFVARPGPAGWAWTLLVPLGLFGWAKAEEGKFAVHKQEIVASRALDRFLEVHREWREEHGRRPVVFHSYDWGGYLTWHGWPEVKNWIDDRNEAQGKERVQEYFSVLRAEPGWAGKLDRAGVDLICVESGAELTRRLAESPRWQKRYRDDYAVIFERR